MFLHGFDVWQDAENPSSSGLGAGPSAVASELADGGELVEHGPRADSVAAGSRSEEGAAVPAMLESAAPTAPLARCPIADTSQMRRDRRAPFPKMVHSVHAGKEAYLRLSTTIGASWCDMRAVCAVHAGCTLSKSCRTRRPVGHLWAWLQRAADFPSKADHKGCTPTFEERCAARLAFTGLEGAEEWLQAEASPNAGEGDEPSVAM